jgi:putative acetyltransferase
MQVRPEQSGEEQAISDLIAAAFVDAEHSSGAEAMIVRRLRDSGALFVSLVATAHGRLVGQVAFSPVTIGGRDLSWFGLGPVAVAPEHQHRGIGTALIHQGLARLRADGANGCVVLGEPGYYSRFGFSTDPQLWLADVPAGYFQALRFGGEPARGEVEYHAAFGLA